MTEQGEGQPLSAEERLLRAIFGEVSDGPPAEDALSHSVPLEAVTRLPADFASISKFIEEADLEKELADMLDETLSKRLTVQEVTILRGRLGLEDGQVKTLAEVGKLIGKSKTTAWRREKSAIDKLRRTGPIFKKE